MQKRQNIRMYLLCLLLIYCTSEINGQSRYVSRSDHILRIIDTSLVAFRTYYIYPDMVDQIEILVRSKFTNGAYTDLSNDAQLTKQLRADFREITNDRHIWIDIMENLLLTDSDVTIEEIIEEKRQHNFGFVEYKLFDSNIAYLRIDGFDNIQYAKQTATHAMGMLASSNAIILDLRHNHGGHGNMVQFISSYFFEHKVQLNSLYFRQADSLAEAWTDPHVPGQKLLEQPLYILTSENTASAAESFCYTFKHYQRALIIGEPTRGAAHWKETYKYPDIGIFLEIPVARPINPVTNQGWEGKGVQPDIKISAEEALQIALRRIIENFKNDQS